MECRPLEASASTTSPVAHAVGAEDAVGLDDAGRRARDVVVVDAEESGVLGGLAADEGGAGLGAAARDARTMSAMRSGNDLAARDVVGHEERLRTHDDDVVDDHADQVEPDRVVLVDRLRDRDLRADAVGAGREQRLRVGAQRGGVEEAGESADAAEDLGSVGATHRGLHEFDREVAGGRVDPGFGIGVHGASREGEATPPAYRRAACADAGRQGRGTGIGDETGVDVRGGSRMTPWAAAGLRSG